MLVIQGNTVAEGNVDHYLRSLTAGSTDGTSSAVNNVPSALVRSPRAIDQRVIDDIGSRTPGPMLFFEANPSTRRATTSPGFCGEFNFPSPRFPRDGNVAFA